MKKSVTSVFFVILAITIVLGSFLLTTSSSETEARPSKSTVPDFEAWVTFSRNKSSDVTLTVINNGDSEFVVAGQGNYIDNVGSAGSRECSTMETTIKPKQARAMIYQMNDAANHGKKSILVFYFKYGDKWYLGKTGIDNGTEYYLEHN